MKKFIPTSREKFVLSDAEKANPDSHLVCRIRLEFRLEVSDFTDDPDFDIVQRIKLIPDAFNPERNIMTLSNVHVRLCSYHIGGLARAPS